jgi:hypothetical protein
VAGVAVRPEPVSTREKRKLDLEDEVFGAFVKGDSIDVIAVNLGIPYIDCANAIKNRIVESRKERKLLPELEIHRAELVRRALLPGVIAGDVPSCKQYLAAGEYALDLSGEREAVNDGPSVKVEFAFGAASRVRMAAALSGSGEDDLRPAHDPVDRDGDENGEDGRGVGLDLRRDRQG